MAKTTCSVEGCEKPIVRKAYGWCEAHYYRWRRYGDVHGGGPSRQSNEGRVCSAEGCKRQSKRRGMCDSHYYRWHEGRDHLTDDVPIGDLKLGVPPEERFWLYVEELDGHWLWMGYVLPNGYGRFWTGTAYTGAHRWAHEYFIGPIPEGFEIDHLCRVRNCVRPEHLEAVDHRTNVLRGAVKLRYLRQQQ